jgi:ABC-type uncharacterized transport system permease subunit
MNEFFGALADVATSEAAWISAAAFAALLAFGAVGEWVSEKSGAMNISLEAMLLAGAFGGAIGYDLTESTAAAMAFGALGGVLIATLQAHLSHHLSADQFVVGLTLNIGVLGLSGFLDGELDPNTVRAARTSVPLLSDIPLVGDALFNQPWPMYLLYPLIPAAWWLVYRTRWGLEIRAVGERPDAAHASGIAVNLRRRQAIYFTGLTAGLGGAYLTLGLIGSFDASMVGGRGFIAIAAVIFGGWTLSGTLGGCLLFGTVLSLRLSLPLVGYDLNNELLTSLPFVVTLIVMTMFAQRVRAPGALAQPFVGSPD